MARNAIFMVRTAYSTILVGLLRDRSYIASYIFASSEPPPASIVVLSLRVIQVFELCGITSESTLSVVSNFGFLYALQKKSPAIAS
jgi:hypothetical protein